MIQGCNLLGLKKVSRNVIPYKFPRILNNLSLSRAYV